MSAEHPTEDQLNELTRLNDRARRASTRLQEANDELDRAEKEFREANDALEEWGAK